MSVMYQHVQGRAKSPAEINPTLPPGVSDIIIRAMSVDKTKRQASMDDLRLSLEKYL